MPTARSWTLSEDAWDTLWSALPVEAVALVESPYRTALAHRGDLPGERWDSGDAFAEAWHLRFMRLGSRIRAVIVGEVPLPSGIGTGDATLELEPDGAEREVVLWGRREGAELFWLELPLPHLMTPENALHPEDASPPSEPPHTRRTLRIQTYRDSEGLAYHRLVGLSYAATDENGLSLRSLHAAEIE